MKTYIEITATGLNQNEIKQIKDTIKGIRRKRKFEYRLILNNQKSRSRGWDTRLRDSKN